MFELYKKIDFCTTDIYDIVYLDLYAYYDHNVCKCLE